MKYLYQFGIIAAVSLAGEILKNVVPLPIPATVWGLIIMLVLLLSKVVKLEQVKTVAEFLVQIMPIMFVPASVGLIVIWPQLTDMLVPLVVISAVSTIIVMVVSGRVTQSFLKEKNFDE